MDVLKGVFSGSSALTHEIKKAWSTSKKEGDKVPDVTFMTRVRIESTDENPFDWKPMTTADLFGGKRIVVLSLPGAFTPTCSSTHVPGYDKIYDEIKALDVDDVYCKSFLGVILCMYCVCVWHDTHMSLTV